MGELLLKGYIWKGELPWENIPFAPAMENKQVEIDTAPLKMKQRHMGIHCNTMTQGPHYKHKGMLENLIFFP